MLGAGGSGLLFGLSQIQVTVEDRVSAFFGSLSCIVGLLGAYKHRKPETPKT
jgi:hypothetical protein